MTRALVVFESMFGNTATIAQAVADGLRSTMDVDVVEVGAAPESPPEDLDLLVVGGPTHAFGLTRPSTRQDATRQAGHAVVSGGIGLREWLDVLRPPDGLAAVAFDTRVRRPHLPGSAAHGADRRLRRLGVRTIMRPESFWVGGTPGPLLDGETERARTWGERVAAALGGVPLDDRGGTRRPKTKATANRSVQVSCDR
jgi:hypothetical protein